MRPKTLDEVVGQTHLVGPGAPLRRLIEADRLPTSIFYGPPGTGKTTVARLAAAATGKRFVLLSAPSAGVAEVRAVVEEARRALGEEGRGTIVFLDELHRFSRAQQDSLLAPIEEGLIVLIGATAENPWFALSPPLASRASLWRFESLSDEGVTAVLARAAAALGVEVDDEALRRLAASVSGDARAALGTLEVAALLAEGRPLGSKEVRAARDMRMLAQGEDAHYDQASAFIKSLRGSDPDAALYWMARMLDAGEDPRFLARRMVILASEDVGLADPNALQVAVAAAEAVEVCGMPEAELCLAEAAVYLAVAPKSNSVTAALARAKEAVQGTKRAEVPAHLRDPRSAEAKGSSGNAAYRYPHDDPRGYVAQEYLPPGLAGSRLYRPGSHGVEPLLTKWLEERREPPEVGREDQVGT
jgi:putative ATPase